VLLLCHLEEPACDIDGVTKEQRRSYHGIAWHLDVSDAVRSEIEPLAKEALGEKIERGSLAAEGWRTWLILLWPVLLVLIAAIMMR
jgi:hypothetical protein